jgi:hypothetical protein
MMKKYIYLFIIQILISLYSCGGQKDIYMYTSFHEPADQGLRFLYSIDGAHWDSIPGVWLKPEVGLQKVMRDPSIIRTEDGIYRLVWTSSWKGDRGFGYSCSKDLIHWSDERFISVMTDTSTVNVWAPELFYDDTRCETMIVWASCVPHKFERGLEDEDNNHRLYYTTTKDFKTFSKAHLLFDTHFSAIDAMILKRGNNEYVMVLKDNTRNNRNLKVSFARNPHGPWTEPSAPITEDFVEGPTVANTGKGYIIYYDRYRRGDFGALKTSDFRNFTDYTDSISVPMLHKHGTIFRAPEKIVREILKLHKQ